MGKPRAEPSFHRRNKRTAFAVTYTFLAIGGTRITAKADATYAFIIGLHETGTFEFGRLTDWLRARRNTRADGLRVERKKSTAGSGALHSAQLGSI
ncbi:hypothetical protein SAMN05216428_10224 [Nitrosospira sp. Nsp11]|uniref:hypothetical protein n=1 Tax=Nitrosospira sp. Nsp11 TaxID=1855338 RepID=UPI00091F3311|nr:hypothetical protein [Nitrosospira sp. Nsp11]SHL32117.1 hypothetical protein SAMN05216428_10224 [Nitrosospira sp. Nsp11]